MNCLIIDELSLMSRRWLSAVDQVLQEVRMIQGFLATGGSFCLVTCFSSASLHRPVATLRPSCRITTRLYRRKMNLIIEHAAMATVQTADHA